MCLSKHKYLFLLHDEFRLVAVVVIFIEVYGWKYIITGQLKNIKNLTIILPKSLKRTQIYIAQNNYLCLLRHIIMMHFGNGDKPNDSLYFTINGSR